MYIILAVLLAVCILISAGIKTGKSKSKKLVSKKRSGETEAISDEDMLAAALWDDDMDILK